MKINQIYSLGIVACMLTLTACSQKPADEKFDAVRLDEFLSFLAENDKAMGSLSITQDGKEVYQKAIGYATVEDGTPASPNTRYRIGSITKVLTATLTMKLVESGKLTLETTLDQYYPAVKNADQITIEMLLRHRSGVFSITEATDYTSWMEQPITRAELLDKIYGYESAFEPGSKAAYSNSNYILLTFILQDIYEKPYDQILQEELFEPLSLKNISHGTFIESTDARSYTWQGGWEPATDTHPSVPLGAGGVSGNALAINTFLRALIEGEILSTETVNQMKQLKDGFGIGLFQVPFYDKRAFGHTGGIDGFQSNAFYFPEEKVGVTYLSNGVVMPINDLLIGVLSIYFGVPYTFPEFTPALEVSASDLDAYLGIYSSPDFPLKVTITKDGNTLIGQATGQPSFPLEAYETHKFRFDQAGLKLIFTPVDSTMVLQQGGGEFVLKRE